MTYTNVELRVRGDRYVLEVEQQQWQLVVRVVRALLRVVKTPAYARLLVGATKDDAMSILDRADQGGPDDSVSIELTPDELHVLYAALATACLNVRSEEAFYVTNGVYAENVRDLAAAIETALGDG